MKRYGAAFIERVARSQAIEEARALVELPSTEVARTWRDGPVSIVPSFDGRPVAVTDIDVADWRALSLWIGTSKLEYARSELLWRELSACAHRVVFEVAGNSSWIRFVIRCHRDDEQTVRECIAATYPDCALRLDAANWWAGAEFAAYREVAGNWSPARVTLPDLLPDSLLWTCIEWLLSITSEAVGFYQCILEPASFTDVWHRQIEAEHNLAFLACLLEPQTALQRVPQQLPTGELRTRADEMRKKANADLGFFGVGLRCGIVGNDHTRIPQFLAAVRFNGTALVMQDVPPPPREMHDAFFAAGLLCRSGLVLNSAEIATIAHVLPNRDQITKRTDWPVYREDVSEAQAAKSGSPIGHAIQMGQSIPIFIPPSVRSCGTHVISVPGMGKSTLLKHLFLHDIGTGNGAVFIDAHGDALKDLMALLPPKDRGRCIYLDPADNEWVPLFNPLAVPKNADRYRLAGDFLSALERVSSDWGDRLATVLRHALIGLLHLPSATVQDLYNLIRRRSTQSDAIRERIIATCPDQAVVDFWSRDFNTLYTDKDLASSLHKLLKLVSGGAVSRMFAQRESRIDVRQIMDEGKILLVDLSALADDTRRFFGSFLLTLFGLAATARSAQTREERRPFSIFADEGHLFARADAFESLMAQARKFGVNLVLAHQQLQQFERSQIHALRTAGTTIIGRVNRADAELLAKDLSGVSADEISQLKPFEMVARIGTETVRFRSPPSNDKHDASAVDAIIAASRERYCVRVGAAGLRQRSTPTADWGDYANADLSYDEF